MPPGSLTRVYERKLIRTRYERKYPGSDPRSMEVMKHFAEVVGRATPGRLDKEMTLDKNKKRATVKTIRNKIRKFMSQWQRETHLTIPKDVHDSMAPVSVLERFLS